MEVEKMMKQEQDRLNTRKQELLKELSGIDKCLAAITAYWDTLSAPSDTSRAPHGSVRQAVLECISSHPEGIQRKQLLESLGGYNKKSVVNSLSALKQMSAVTAKGGVYKARKGSPRLH